MNTAPTYIASAVTVVMALQSLLGLDFASEQWTAFFVVLSGIFVMGRQILTGRSSLFGGRPDEFTE